PVNTEAKYLLLRHAFKVLGCNRVEFKTDGLSERSRAALLRIGAKQEGVLRSHMITASGRVRDSVYFSIIAAEWPAVKVGLEAKLARPVWLRRRRNRPGVHSTLLQNLALDLLVIPD